MSDEEDSTLPGIKRGIAIGVAFSVSIILIAILAFCVIRRRKARKRKAKNNPEEDLEKEVVLPEKTTWIAPPPPPPLPPVEADARAVYELDATEIAELPSEMGTDTQTAEQRFSGGSPINGEERDVYAHRTSGTQWETWSFTCESDTISPSDEGARGRSPAPAPVSAPMVSSSNVGFRQVEPSPKSSRNLASRDASPWKALPQLPEAHLGAGRTCPQPLS